MTTLDGIAIVGMAGRFPGARSVAAFWDNLLAGVESISFFSREELAAAGVPAKALAHPGYVGASAVLADFDRFDAGFFGFTPREAALLDPQARLFMECAWEALEHAGYAPDAFDGLIGLYGGVGAGRYFMRNVLPAAAQLDGAGAYQAMIANDKDFVPPWVSYKLNLRGPSVAVQTACSTSLVAVHMAAQSLLAQECDIAIAGGVSLALDDKAGYIHEPGGILSPDGHCRPFDARAQGTVHGSGAAIVVLRRLEDAVASGDAIVAVIKGSAINNDGAMKVGFTAPGADGQAEVIAMAQALAAVDPGTIGMVVGHGTGTPVGDPIEVAALTRVFRRQTDRTGYCALGSLKGNVGHLDAAAGAAGLIKAALAVEHGRIPPTLHFERPNPLCDLPATPFFVNADTRDWPVPDGPRRAAVSSFGIGGTNAHVVLEQAPAQRASGASRPWQIVPLSAHTPTALEAATVALADALDRDEPPSLADVAYTLAIGRQAREHRRVVIGRDVDDALDRLDAGDAARVFTGVAPAMERPIAFMFPGQGSQHVGMAGGLYDDEPFFRQELDRCAAIVRRTSGLDLIAVLYPRADGQAQDAAALDRTDVCHLALFSVEFALARFLMSLGVTPAGLIGHSVGEYVAACLAGVFTLEDALAVIAARGRIVMALPAGGGMLAVSAAEADVKALVDPARVSIAVVNGPHACVVAGRVAELESLAQLLDERGVLHRRLDVAEAFHSHLMDEALPAFRDVMRGITLGTPSIPFISNVTGTWIRAEEAVDPEYWVRQLRRTVVFGDGLREILKDPLRIAIEVGPGRTLQGLALQQRARGSQHDIIAALPDARDRRSCAEALALALGRCWIAGVRLDWPAYYGREIRNRVHLPTTPFERTKHWIDAPAVAPIDATRRDFADWFYTPAWRQAPVAARGGYYDESRSWLLVGDAVPLMSALAAALRGRGQRVTLAAPGDAPPPVALDHVVCFSPDYPRLVRTIQAVSDSAAAHPLVLDVIQPCVHAVTGDEALDPANATGIGAALVAPLEIHGLRCRTIDVVPDLEGEALTALVEQLLREFGMPPGGEPVALRGRFRWVLGHSRVDPPGNGASRLRERGVYWITGGTGGIGLTLAEHLARTRRARLVLTNRTLPARGDRRSERIRAMEAAGAEVLLLAADVTSVEAMQRAADEVEARFGELHGVIHAAGVAGGRLMALQDPEGAAAVMAPKIAGAINLAAAADRFHPDFLLFCSSLGVQIGTAGQADYTGGNAFLDAFARTRRAAGLPAIAVNWDRWREVGMAAAIADTDAIGPDEGVRAFEAILGLDLPQVVVSTVDLATRLTAARTIERSSAGAAHDRPALSTDYVTPATAAEAAVAAIWREILGLARVGLDDNFFELGGDSLTALRFTTLYRERANITLPVTALYAAPTIRRLLGGTAAAAAAAPALGR
jgi:acyl transferase domain-containing protein/NAD(P)-dependent dehydrogenase (short-subunit alcohol dehydrogenase family)